MIIFQGRKKFNSLEQAKMKLDPSGKRVAIDNGERVVTIRPQVVLEFPGTLEQLYELGLKLGGYPIELWKKKRGDCEERDAAKEKVFAATLQLMAQAKHAIGHDVIEHLKKSVIFFQMLYASETDINKYDSVGDFLCGGEHYSEDGIKSIKHASYEINQMMGSYVAGALLQQMRRELDLWLNDANSVYFIKPIDLQRSEPAEIYQTILTHPDFKHQNDSILDGFFNDLFNMNPRFISAETKQEGHFNRHEPADQDDEWTIESLLAKLSQEELKELLELYFAKINPLRLVREAYAFCHATKDVIKNMDDEEKAEPLNYLSKDIERALPLLEHIAELLSENDDFVFEAMVEEASEEDEDEEDFEFEDDDDDEDEFSPVEEHYISEILTYPYLSWKDKAIYAFAYFVGEGTIGFDEILANGKDKKQSVLTALQNLEADDFGFYDEEDEVFCTEVTPEEIDDEDEIDEQLIEILSNDGLSWKAKGMALFLYFSAGSSFERLLEASSDGAHAVKSGLLELKKEGLIPDPEAIKQATQDLEEKLLARKEEAKRDLQNMYEGLLKPQLEQWLKDPVTYLQFLNAEYPRYENMTAFQIACILDDGDMVRRLSEVEGIYYWTPKDEDKIDDDIDTGHPFRMANSSHSYAAAEQMIEHNILVDDGLLVEFIVWAILEDAPFPLIKRAIQRCKSLNQETVLGNPLLHAAMKDNFEVVDLLLKCGASPRFRPSDEFTVLEMIELKGSKKMYQFVLKYLLKNE